MSLGTVLLADLSQLSSEARRRHPDVKEAADKQLALIKVYKGRSEADLVRAFQSSTEALKPALLACKARTTKVVAIGVSCIQHLTLRKAFSPELVTQATSALAAAATVDSPDIQLKVLQCLPSLYSGYANVHESALVDLLGLCFKLQHMGSGAFGMHGSGASSLVPSVASATLRQLISLVYEKLWAGITSKPAMNPDWDTLDRATQLKDACGLISDLLLLTNLDQDTHDDRLKLDLLPLETLSPELGLELVDSILAAHSILFEKEEKLNSALKEHLCPIVIRHYTSTGSSYPVKIRVIRLMRTVCQKLIRVLPTECEVFLTMLLKDVESILPLAPSTSLLPNAISQNITSSTSMAIVNQILALEMFQFLTQDFTQLREIYVAYEQKHGSGGIFYDLVSSLNRWASRLPTDVSHTENTMGKLLEGVANELRTGQHHVVSHDALRSSCGPRLPYLEQLDKHEVPHISPLYAHLLAMRSLINIVNSLAFRVLPIFDPTDLPPISIGSSSLSKAYALPNRGTVDTESVRAVIHDVKSEHHADLRTVAFMAEIAWPAILASYSSFFSVRIDDGLFFDLVTASRLFVCFTGVLELATPRDAFITLLAKYSVNPGSALIHYTPEDTAHVGMTGGIGSTGNVASLVMTKASIPERSLVCLSALIRAVKYLANFIDFACWATVLNAFEDASILLQGRTFEFQRRNTSDGLPPVPVAPIINAGLKRSESSVQHAMSYESSLSSRILIEMEELFTSSVEWEDVGLQEVIQGLCTVSSVWTGYYLSTTTLPDVNVQKRKESKHPEGKSFGIEGLRHVAIQNVPRLVWDTEYGFWEAITDHLVGTIGFVNGPVGARRQALEAFIDVFQSCMTCIMDHDLEQKIREEVVPRIQLKLLKAMKNVLTSSSSERFSNDVRTACLGALYQFLQSYGEALLSNSWDLVLSAIGEICDPIDRKKEVVAPTNEPLARTSTPTNAGGKVGGDSLLRNTFPCVQLVCSDFLSSLSPISHRQVIRLLGMYCRQQDDMNLSLTAINLLWTVSDFLRSSDEDVADEVIEGSVITEETLEEQIGDEMSMKSATALWLLLLLQLRSIGADPRPEVRNSANQSLFRTVSANGATLSPSTWYICLSLVLFPLVKDINMSGTSDQEWQPPKQKFNESISKSPMETPKSVRSNHAWPVRPRKTESEWDETRTIVISGMVQVLRDNLEILVLLTTFSTFWEQFLHDLRSWICFGSQIVAIRASEQLKELLSIGEKANPASMTSTLWEQLPDLWWTAYAAWELTCSEFVDDILREEPAPRQSAKIITNCVISFRGVYGILKHGFLREDMHRILQALSSLAQYPLLDEYTGDTDRPNSIQAAVLDVFTYITREHETCYDLIFHELITCASIVSFSSDAGVVVPGSGRKPTFIAFAYSVVALASDALKVWPKMAELYDSPMFAESVKLLTDLRKRYYAAPLMENRKPYWKEVTAVATDAILHWCQFVSEDDRELLHLEEIYLSAIKFIEGLSPITKDNQSETTVVHHENGLHEAVTFERCAPMLIKVLNRLPPETGKAVAVNLIDTLVAVTSACRLPVFDFYTSDEESDPSDKIFGTLSDVPACVGEKFFTACIKFAFELCVSDNEHVPGTVESYFREKFKESFFNHAIHRLKQYLADAKVHNGYPMQKIRRQEIQVYLHQLEAFPATIPTERMQDFIAVLVPFHEIVGSSPVKEDARKCLHALSKRPWR